MKKKLLYIELLIIVISLFVAFLAGSVLNFLPNSNQIKNLQPEQSTLIYDKNNNLVAEINKDENRVCVPLESISPYLINAVIAIEDNRFFEHNGVDLKGTIRAFVNNLNGGAGIQGGSTITQQLIKNHLLLPEKSFKRKFIEAILAIRLENIMSKHDILQNYLNTIYLGNRSYGIEKAANNYFDKPAKDLNLAEAALLASLIKAPESYSPYLRLNTALERQKIVLDKMLQYGYITKNQQLKAINTKIILKNQTQKVYKKNAYFIDYVVHSIREEYGAEILDRGGLKVYTSLDATAQEKAEKVIEKGVKTYGFSGIKQGALISIDVKTGYITALVGGIDYDKSQFNRAIMAHRAVGSGFKPIVYLTGLRLGIITPDTILIDAPIAYKTKWNTWRPRNWDGKYMGKMTVRKALTLSRNTPTVRVALNCGIDNVITTARQLGIKSPINRGYSIVLGSAGVTPLEVATVYSTLAREGVYIEPTAIRYITDNNGNVIDFNAKNPQRVVKSDYVRQLNSILIDVIQKGTGKNAILTGRQVAGKTGTTDDFKDIWFSGFTPDTITTIWLGNDENLPLKGVWSSNCATLWKEYTEYYYKHNDIIAENFIMPKNQIIPLHKEKIAENKSKNAKKPQIIGAARGNTPAAQPSKKIKPPVRAQYTAPQKVAQQPKPKIQANPQQSYPTQQVRAPQSPQYYQYYAYPQQYQQAPGYYYNGQNTNNTGVQQPYYQGNTQQTYQQNQYYQYYPR